MEEADPEFVAQLIRSKEGPSVEWKTSGILSDPHKIALSMAALANTNGGYFLLGITPDGKWEGLKEDEAHSQTLINVARNNCDPPLWPILTVCRRDGRVVWVCQIKRFSMFPHAAKGNQDYLNYPIRVGDTTRAAQPIDIAQLFQSSGRGLSEKKPKLNLFLLDESGEAVKKIQVSPTYEKIIKKKAMAAMVPSAIVSQFAGMAATVEAINAIGQRFSHRDPPKDFVQVNLELQNNGEVPAQGINISLEYPQECEFLPQSDSFLLLGAGNSIELDESCNPVQGRTIIKKLSNDRKVECQSSFFVKFPERATDHIVKATVFQDGFPPEDFELIIQVVPQFEEKIVYEEE